MKRLIFLLITAFLQVYAQNAFVVEDKAITNPKDGKFFFPVVSPDGINLLFSSEGYKGLWIKNLTTNKLTKISSANGAGYEPGFSDETDDIIFREDKFIKGKRSTSLISYNTSSKKSVVLESAIRDLKICRDNNNAFLNYVKDSEVRTTIKQTLSKKVEASNRIVFLDNLKIVISENNNNKILLPLGEGNYIWPSLSPDKTKLLFTAAGKGTYISFLDGTIWRQIGYANFPSWSPDGNWILFMKDLDDGEKIISSDLYIANINTGKYYNLTTGRDDIELYPCWGTTNNEIFYNTNSGQIRKITLKYE